ncbi:histidine kinase [Microbulbifer sp. CNSA002]|uniref:FG-GAP repeat protein n=1 Tax=Microbulbifer sp. CNSA002 TaxID=3373604 RepID=UPI0039B56BD9
MSFKSIKLFEFNWDHVEGAIYYRLQENPDGASGFSQIGSDIQYEAGSYILEVPLHSRVNAQYILQACNNHGCSNSDILAVNDPLIDSIGYLKSSDSTEGEYFGGSIALSGDGNTLAVGAPGELLRTENSNPPGTVYIFTRNNLNWTEQASLQASNADKGDYFGHSISLSNDGNKLAIGAHRENSSATGINGDQGNSSFNSFGFGAVYLFSRTSNTWTQQVYIKPSNSDLDDAFGYSVSLSGDGKTLAVGARGEDSSSSGINGDQTSNDHSKSGAVYIFNYNKSNWKQQAYIKAGNTGPNSQFGRSVSLSNDGNTLAVSAPFESSGAKGINSFLPSYSAASSGAVYIFTRPETTWTQQSHIKASNSDKYDLFGSAIHLSSDASTLAVGAIGERSFATGINGNQENNDALDYTGAVYIFVQTNADWVQQSYLKAHNTELNYANGGDIFGFSVSLSENGDTLAVGALGEDSHASGINGDEQDNNAQDSGAIYIYTRSNTTWSKGAYIKSSTTEKNDEFSHSVSLSADGNTLVVGAPGEDSNATGIGGDKKNNGNPNSGAVFIY